MFSTIMLFTPILTKNIERYIENVENIIEHLSRA
jgi:hypothetical protein